MSMVFGKENDTVAKSWSDLWDEEAEESEQEELAFKDRQSHNSRRWSDESERDLTVRPRILTEAKSHSSINVQRNPEPKMLPRQTRMTSPNENEPFGFRNYYQKYSADKSGDKWEALGEKRRNYQAGKDNRVSSVSKKRSMTVGWRKDGQRDNRGGGRPAWLDQKDWRVQRKEEVIDDDDTEWVGVFNLHL